MALQFPKVIQACASEKAEVSGGESVGFAQRPHGYILCSPVSNTGNFAKTLQKCVGVNDPLKVDFACANGASQRANGFGSCSGPPDVGKLGVGESFRRGKKMSKSGWSGECF